MQSEVQISTSQPRVHILAALVSLEILNILLWLLLSYGARLLVTSGIGTGAGYRLMIIVGAYPILLLSPLLTKWHFRRCSLLPLYALNLTQMGVVTWLVVH